MRKSAFITARVVAALAILAFFNTGCDFIVDILRAIGRLCEAPEFVVTTTADNQRGLCTPDECSLRDAIGMSNACPGTQTIRVPAGTYLLTRAGSDEDANRRGDLDITDSVIVNGDGEAVIDGNAAGRVLDIFAPAHATLTSITVANGNGVEAGGIRNAGTLTMQGGSIRGNAARRGGGLLNLGTAALDSVEIRANLVDRGDGGGVYNQGDLTMTGGWLSGNTAPRGAGLFNAGTAGLDSVAVERNTAAGNDGGGIFNQGDLTIQAGSLDHNEARRGGGLFNEATAALNGVTVEANALDRAPGGASAGAWGGGLYNSNDLTVTGASLKNNGATYGGGIANVAPGTLDLDGVLLEGNRADVDGGGIFNSGGSIQAAWSSFVRNGATGAGGALNNVTGKVVIESSTISGNRAYSGAGIVHEVGEMQLTNVTISGNQNLGEFHGAGIANRGFASLTNVTAVFNLPDDVWYEGAWGFVYGTRFKSSIVGACILGDPRHPFESAGYNLDAGGACLLSGPGDLSGLDPLLGPLAANGGPTLTHALLPGSPAIDASDSCLAADQRGFPRPRPTGGACDIGAYEYDPGNTGGPTPTPAAAAETDPVFTFSQNANCRKGPGTPYDIITSADAGQQAAVEGRSQTSGWYYVLLPNGGPRCWVSASTGEVSESVDGLPVIPAPPLPVAPAAPVLNVSTKVCTSGEYVVRLSWKDVEGETGYRVYRDGVLIANLAANATAYDDISPDYNPHEYYVEAFNAVGATASLKTKSPGCVY